MPLPQYRVTGNVPLLDRVRGVLKRTRVISRTAKALGANRIGDFAYQRGYGRSKSRKRSKSMKGGSSSGYALRDKYGAYAYVPYIG